MLQETQKCSLYLTLNTKDILKIPERCVMCIGVADFWLNYLPRVDSQIREQMSGPDLYVLTVGFLALKKTGFSEKKNSSQKK